MAGTRGKARTKLLDHSAGLVEGLATGPSWDFIYERSLVKHPSYNVGDRVALPDSRVYRYGKSASALNVDFGCKFNEDEVQGYEALKNAQAVGDTEVVFTGASHAALAEDELRGGYIIIFHDGGGGDTQFRGIVGNPASAANANITVYLDGGLDHAVIAGTTAAELFYNPYASLIQVAGSATGRSFAGKPAVQIAAADTYFWVQTWGPCWLAPSVADGTWGTNYHRGAFWRLDGSIQVAVAIGSLDSDNTTQYAGFVINEGYSAGPLFMLQVSP